MSTNLAVASDKMAHATDGERLEPDYKVLQRLRRSCRITLERYVDVASSCSGQLACLTPGPPNDLKRANLALLRQKEERAYEVYLKARGALLEYVLGGGE